jgi:hypothetical protein
MTVLLPSEDCIFLHDFLQEEYHSILHIFIDHFLHNRGGFIKVGYSLYSPLIRTIIVDYLLALSE